MGMRKQLILILFIVIFTIFIYFVKKPIPKQIILSTYNKIFLNILLKLQRKAHL